MLKQQDLLKGLIWITLLAIFDQLIFLLAFQLAKGSSVRVALGEGILGQVLFYPVVAKAIAFFLLAQGLAYGALLLAVWFCCQQLRGLFPWFLKRYYWFGTLLWLLVFTACFLGNMIYFPNSFYALWLTSRVDYFLVWFAWIAAVWAALVVLLSALGLGCALYFVSQHRHKRWVQAMVVGGVALGGCQLAWGWYQQHQPIAPVFSQPNIIIIGLDAVRPDYVGFNNPARIGLTPHLDAFLKEAVIFEDTLTPLARTFPAWMSILTGKYPKYHGARFNLDAPQFLHVKETFPMLLQRQGYETWFATDETRFSNIELSFGFDHMVKPLEGANDFLLGTLNDFPLTNLLVNSWLGEKLFPYSYANRAAYVTYRPTTFVKRLEKQLPHQAQLKKPLFLSMHLLLTHWPNEWADSRFNQKTLLTDRYVGSVHAIDQQWGEIMAMLKNKKLLDNAIIVVLSDHGESLGLPGDRVLQESKHKSGRDSLKQVERTRYVFSSPFSFNFKKDFGIDASYGHGTDVLSLSQYQTLMAWQRTGDKAWSARRIQMRVSLLDIAPTIIDMIHAVPPASWDGVVLTDPVVQGKQHTAPRDFYIEDGYKIPALKTAHISVSEVLSESLHAYDINAKDGKVTMKPEIEKRGIAGKAYAIMRDHWLVAFYPPYKEDVVMNVLSKAAGESEDAHANMEDLSTRGRWYVVDLKTKAWSADLEAAWTKQTPAAALRQKLIAFYGKEIRE